MSWWDIITTMLEENDDLKLSNMRDSGLMGAATQHWTLVLNSLTSLIYTNRQTDKGKPNAKWVQEFKFSKKKHVVPSDPYFSRDRFFFPKLFLSFACSIFLRRYLKLLPHRLFFPQKLSQEYFSSEVLIFQTFLPVFNSTCDKNPSCRLICEKQTSMHKNAYRISDPQGKTK